MKRLFPILSAIAALPAFAANPVPQPGIVRSEFIFESAPFPSCHASTVVETKHGLVAAWFGGTREGAPDVGIWLSRHLDGQWTAPVEVANRVTAEGTHFACYNPVLFQPPNAPLLLFYKAGGSPSGWLAFLKTSSDDGATWSAPSQLPDGFVGPVKNKPVLLPDGSILCGASLETPEKPSKWHVQFERTADLGKTWTKTQFLNDGLTISAIQPSILFPGGEGLLAIGRTRQQHLFRIASKDGGKTWGEMTLTTLPNPNSGTDAVTLRDGRHLLVYNHTAKGRSPLNVAISKDGQTWAAALVLESDPGEYSYPAVIQTGDGLVHTVYTWKRQRIKHVVIDPAKLVPNPIVDGQWPSQPK
jgi:predicted neuraminidase